MVGELGQWIDIRRSLIRIPHYLLRPVRLFRDYNRINLRFDLIAGLTVAVILLPQAIAFALIVELPPAMGLYAAIIAAIFGALWGSSDQSHTGPTNAISLLVLSVLMASFQPATTEFIVAAGLLAVMAGIFQLLLGLARLGMLVNFVSHSVIVGFSTGAGLLIAIRQLSSLLGIHLESESVFQIMTGLVTNFASLDRATTLIGFSTIILILLLRRINRRLPASLIAMIGASAAVYFLNLDESGVAVIGKLPQQFPPLANLPIFNLDFISRLSTGALAVGAIGLVETSAISRSISTQTGQRLDSNQEFVGQGLANIAAGLFSGYPVAGSFSRSAVNFSAGARTPLAAIFSSFFVLTAMFLLAPLAAFLPRAALSGVLIIVAIGMVDRHEIARIWRGTLGDTIIMVVTFAGTLFVEIAFAVLAGILLSFARYIIRTSTPRVNQVVPDDYFKHFVYQPSKPNCPQLGVVDVLGDLYFGAVTHVEESILDLTEKHPEQRYLLIRMHNVNQCDFTGIHMLESIVRYYRERGGDVFLVHVGQRVNQVMQSTGFCDLLGLDHFLDEDVAINHIFYRVLDPVVCIYECPYRVFAECQNLPKRDFVHHEEHVDDYVVKDVEEIEPKAIWESVRGGKAVLQIIDVREPREYHSGHIPTAELMPLPRILAGEVDLKNEDQRPIVLACRTGRRSKRAARELAASGREIRVLKGGMVAWEAASLLEAIDD